MKQKLLATICSALEYLLDRGEIETISEIETSVRYHRPQPKIDELLWYARTGSDSKLLLKKSYNALFLR